MQSDNIPQRKIAAVDQLNTFIPSKYMFFSLELKWKNNSRENAFFAAPSNVHVLTSDNAAGDSFWWQLQNVLIVFHAWNKHAVYQKMCFI